MIAGFNGAPPAWISYQYDFLRLPLVWGWASWRRAWEGYDPEMKDWKHLRQTDFLDRWAIGNDRLRRHLISYFDAASGLRQPFFNSWDYPLTYHFIKNSLLTIFPKTNLVTNLGMGHPAAVNTTVPRLLPKTQPLPEDLPPPPFVYPNWRVEHYLTKTFWEPPLYYRAYLRIQADLHYGTLWQTFTSKRFWKKAIRIALRKY